MLWSCLARKLEIAASILQLSLLLAMTLEEGTKYHLTKTFQKITKKTYQSRMLSKRTKERKDASLDFNAIFWLFLISSCPLYLDQMAEAGGVRGALICRRSGSLFLSYFYVLFIPFHTTIIDPFSMFLCLKCRLILSCVLYHYIVLRSLLFGLLYQDVMKKASKLL